MPDTRLAARVAVAAVLAAACVGAHSKDSKDWYKKSSRYRHRKNDLWRHAEDSAHAFEKVCSHLGEQSHLRMQLNQSFVALDSNQSDRR